MDPVSQGVLGAIFTQVKSSKADLAKAAIIGALAAMAPDLDVLIRSTNDPLLALEFHRHFTHSLLFIPVGAFLCSLLLYFTLAKKWQLSFGVTYVWSLIGYATHGLLDGCTSYGTQLFWPLSNERFSWDIISIVDPLFTIPLLVMAICAARQKKRGYVIASISWCVLYLSIGWVQNYRAIEMGYQLAESRGHDPIRLEAKPSFANLAVRKIVYETEQNFYVAAVKPGLGEQVVWVGDHIAKLDLERDLPWLDIQSQQAKDIERFRWFSAGYLALDPNNPNRVIDMRYSILPNQINPLWGIELQPDADRFTHVDFVSQRSRDAQASLVQIVDMVFATSVDSRLADFGQEDKDRHSLCRLRNEYKTTSTFTILRTVLINIIIFQRVTLF
jgi:inner membrane protein